MTIVRCNETDCKFNTVIRLRGGAERATCCNRDDLVISGEDVHDVRGNSFTISVCQSIKLKGV